MHPRQLAATLIAPLILVACGNGPGNDDPLDPTWPQVSQIFGQSCAFSGCHAAGSAQVVLEGEAAFDNIVDVLSDQVPSLALVAPGDPDASYLYLKVADLQGDACTQDGQEPADCRERMPPPPNPQMSAARIQAIHDWIADGALRNE